jgi:hypothetical protein
MRNTSAFQIPPRTLTRKAELDHMIQQRQFPQAVNGGEPFTGIALNLHQIR